MSGSRSLCSVVVGGGSCVGHGHCWPFCPSGLTEMSECELVKTRWGHCMLVVMSFVSTG